VAEFRVAAESKPLHFSGGGAPVDFELRQNPFVKGVDETPGAVLSFCSQEINIFKEANYGKRKDSCKT